MELKVRVVGTTLPGLESGGRSGVHVALERGKEPMDATPGDAKSAVFDFVINVVDDDVRGPYVHGKRGERFVRLTWGVLGADDSWDMFRRAKIRLQGIDDLIAAAVDSGGVLEATVSLSTADGSPKAGSFKPDQVEWRIR